MKSKKELGQYFTKVSPFDHELFYEWYEKVKDVDTLLEPFAGSNNIIRMIEELGISREWDSYDIEPPEDNSVLSVNVVQRDTLNEFPMGYKVAITNPPYLARNSARRRGLSYPDSKYDDLYKVSLSVMLNNLEYVAAIIPESFITQCEFKDRLFGVVSLNTKMFDDTETPVCLALFTPNSNEDYKIYIGDELIGSYIGLKEEQDLFSISEGSEYIKWKFNDPYGQIGINAVDNTKGQSIEFIRGEDVSGEVKVSSRAITRVSGVNFDEYELVKFLDICNNILLEYRDKTQDVFMTSFKGLRDDDKYRRRLSFSEARVLLNKGYEVWLLRN